MKSLKMMTKTLNYSFSEKHRRYMRKCLDCTINVAEGAVRAGKTVDNVFVFAYLLENTPDKIHLATGSTIANAKLNIGDCNGMGLEAIFRGRCKWGKYKDNECLRIKTHKGEKVVIFAGGAKSDSYKKIRGNSYGMWIATEINLHHDTVIKEAFNRQLAAGMRKIFWDLNPDNPKSEIYKNYLDVFEQKQKDGTMYGGYNYCHFTIRDNLSVSAERLKEISGQYDKNSIWYKRDILGLRCTADGLIYTEYAGTPERFSVDLSNSENRTQYCRNIDFADIGVDIGGNRSLTTFVVTGIHKEFKAMTVLMDGYIEGKKGEIDPERVYRELKDFIRKFCIKYPGIKIRAIHPDSAEQYMITGLRKTLSGLNMTIPVVDSLKLPIIERIRCLNAMIASERFFLEKDCAAVDDGLRNAVWDAGAAALGNDRRADDFTSNIDILDAFEYSFENYTGMFTPEIKNKKKMKSTTAVTAADFKGGWI